MAQLTCDDVSLGYDGVTFIKNLTFQVNKGDYLCIFGENGSGKSTLIKNILRLNTPLSGKIILDDGLKPEEIGYLPQQTSAQRDFPASVYEIVLSGRLNSLKLRPFYSRKDRKEANKMIEFMGIEKLSGKCYRELSGGQQQRVLLARALCATKKMLLLDEPVAGLDPLVTDSMYSLIEHINTELEITVIMVSHDIRSSLKYATHVLHIDHETAFFGSADEYKNSSYCRMFLGGGSDV
ncbi:MAG: ABC transporter ATP-binding protein [Firmicutes bacterium]|nr:ABC transporter ATP-binding protein [Bacillota bacterium]